MNTLERIRGHFAKLVAENKLKPGDKLPKYADICEQFGITWTSAQRAYKKLEQGGYIRIVHGVGSFLNGGDDLDVDLYLYETTFDFEWLSELLNRIAREHDLHLKIHLKDRMSADYQTNVAEHRAVIAENDSQTPAPGPLLDYSVFEDYKATDAQFKPYEDDRNSSLLPFYMFTYQAALRTDLCSDIAFLKKFTAIDSLDWWDDVAAICRKRGIVPAEYKVTRTQQWGFPFLPLALLMMQDKKASEPLYGMPFFETEQGERMFRILDDFHSFESGPESFLHNDILFDLSLGSWAAVHAKTTKVKPDQFRILPLMRGKKKIVCCLPCYLQTFTNATITWNEKTRIWRFLKLMLSKDVQKEMAAESGFISMRRDMKVSDHEWASRPDLLNFFPGPHDLLINRISLSKVKEATLTALYQAYRECHADSGEIRRFMDQKLRG